MNYPNSCSQVSVGDKVRVIQNKFNATIFELVPWSTSLRMIRFLAPGDIIEVCGIEDNNINYDSGFDAIDNHHIKYRFPIRDVELVCRAEDSSKSVSTADFCTKTGDTVRVLRNNYNARISICNGTRLLVPGDVIAVCGTGLMEDYAGETIATVQYRANAYGDSGSIPFRDVELVSSHFGFHSGLGKPNPLITPFPVVSLAPQKYKPTPQIDFIGEKRMGHDVTPGPKPLMVGDIVYMKAGDRPMLDWVITSISGEIAKCQRETANGRMGELTIPLAGLTKNKKSNWRWVLDVSVGVFFLCSIAVLVKLFYNFMTAPHYH